MLVGKSEKRGLKLLKNVGYILYKEEKRPYNEAAEGCNMAYKRKDGVLKSPVFSSYLIFFPFFYFEITRIIKREELPCGRLVLTERVSGRD